MQGEQKEIHKTLLGRGWLASHADSIHLLPSLTWGMWSRLIGLYQLALQCTAKKRTEKNKRKTECETKRFIVEVLSELRALAVRQ